MRREGLSARDHDGGNLFRRAAPADALPRREGDLDPEREKGFWDVPQGGRTGQGKWLVLREAVETKANADIHERTTAREIVKDFEGERLDYVVTGYGTGGTVTGIGRVLRKERPETKIILTEPANAKIVGSGSAQERLDDGSPAGSHPNWQPHPIQGWTPDFIPLVLQEAIDKNYYDELLPVAGPDGMAWSKRLAAEEGIFTGISGGSTFATAIKVAEDAPDGSVILCMLPDIGERYLSTLLFEDVEAVMTEDEIALMKSTPGYHFGG